MPQSIIDVANATFSIAGRQQTGSTSTEKLSASTQSRPFASISSSEKDVISQASLTVGKRWNEAETSTGVSPDSVLDRSSIQTPYGSSERNASLMAPSQVNGQQLTANDTRQIGVTVNPRDEQQQLHQQLVPSASGLDALALLATQQQTASLNTVESAARDSHLAGYEEPVASNRPSATTSISSSCSSSDNDEEPGYGMSQSRRRGPGPIYGTRRGGRRRSLSAPESMEKWAPSSRLQLVLPAAILEEELAEATLAMETKEAELARQKQANDDHSSYHYEDEPHSGYGVEFEPMPSAGEPQAQTKLLSIDEPEEEEEEEEEILDHSELLRRARSRLLEDLSEGNLNGEKGVLTMPHTLAKYKEVYNKNGRIGIYTPAERAAIIARFHEKRTRRTWNKRIRYSCRKNLADRRLRVKGRFVKRMPDAAKNENPATGNDMPDTSDPDAAFVPTEDQPYRRLRRHTIT